MEITVFASVIFYFSQYFNGHYRKFWLRHRLVVLQKADQIIELPNRKLNFSLVAKFFFLGYLFDFTFSPLTENANIFILKGIYFAF